MHGNREDGDAVQLTSATEEGNCPISRTAPMLGVDGEVEPIAVPADGSVEIPGETAYVAAVYCSQSARNADNCLPSRPSSDTGVTEPELDPEQVPEGSRGESTLTSLLASPSQEFQAALHSDASLENLRQLAETPTSMTDKERVFWKRGRLYRETVPGKSQKEWLRARQLVVPHQFRSELLRIAHEIPLAGHLGISKTKARLFQHFYWPKMGTVVSNYCRSCITCQRVGKARPALKAPLIPLPVIEEPFQRIAVDIVGPLAASSSSGKQYILTVVDYATRYPEAVALSSTRADKVADALLAIFSRVGFPREMFTDQGAQFMSRLMEALCKRMQVKHLVSSAYHPQTNGLCERFNGTLKQMLRMLVETQGRDWERYLPHLLFAYREVPQASTGFSPFELLYAFIVPYLPIIIKDLKAVDVQDPDNSVLSVKPDVIVLLFYHTVYMATIQQNNLSSCGVFPVYGGSCGVFLVYDRSCGVFPVYGRSCGVFPVYGRSCGCSRYTVGLVGCFRYTVGLVGCSQYMAGLVGCSRYTVWQVLWGVPGLVGCSRYTLTIVGCFQYAAGLVRSSQYTAGLLGRSRYMAGLVGCVMIWWPRSSMRHTLEKVVPVLTADPELSTATRSSRGMYLTLLDTSTQPKN
ncbi:unnamed protein product [Ranitomeya imitator]|uniref:Gypsy retrotransposon integrase-like protein 1 n=1 Tax=Ranitomeya imitator TaxID=111125 RepID=A0ABN9LS58_9NEOB|nr:unnamed protein product [Ranitomeya imitator]